MPLRRFPDNPDLAQLRKQAKALRKAAAAGDPEALKLVAELHPRPPAEVRLADAQLVTARQYGFASWPKLVELVGTVRRWTRSPHQVAASPDPADELLRLACLTYGDDYPGRVREADVLLAAHPELARANVFTMAATGDAAALAELLAGLPELAGTRGGPFDWEPLLYLAYSRLRGRRPWITAARTLLAHGADPNAGFLWDGLRSPFTALTGAFGGGESDPPAHPRELALARVLLEAGAEPNDAQTVYNRGLGGSWTDDTAHLELLLDFGFGRGDGGPWKARLGHTLQEPAQLLREELATAALRGGPRRARLLLDHGAEVDGIGSHPAFGGRTPLELAQLNGHTDVAEILAAAGGTARLSNVDTFIAAVMRGDAAAAASLPPAVVAELRGGYAELLGNAAGHGNGAAVRLLAGLGWDVNHRSRTTALHNAAWNDDVDMLRTLVELGADPTITDTEHGATPLGFAEYGGKPAATAYLRSLA